MSDGWGSPAIGSSLSGLAPAEPWMVDAACQYVDPYLWHPSKGDSPSAKQARAICRGCPVVDQCREYAISRGEMHGVWGALMERERRGLIAQRRRITRRAAA